MQDRIDAFFAEMVEAFTAGNISENTAKYDIPIIIVRPIGSRVFDTPAAFDLETKAVRDLFKSRGLAAVRKEVLDLRYFTQGLLSVDIEFRYLDEDGHLITTLHSTYHLRPEGDSFRIVAHVSHDEIFERPIG